MHSHAASPAAKWGAVVALCLWLAVGANSASVVPIQQTPAKLAWPKERQSSLFQQVLQHLGLSYAQQPAAAQKGRSSLSDKKTASRPFFLHESTLALTDRVTGTHLIPNTKAVVGLNAVWVKPQASFSYTKVLQWTPDYTLSPQKTRVLASQRVSDAPHASQRTPLSYEYTDPASVSLRYLSGRKAAWTIANDTYIAEKGRLYVIRHGSRSRRTTMQTPPQAAFGASEDADYPQTNRPKPTTHHGPASNMRFRGSHRGNGPPRARSKHHDYKTVPVVPVLKHKNAASASHKSSNPHPVSSDTGGNVLHSESEVVHTPDFPRRVVVRTQRDTNSQQLNGIQPQLKTNMGALNSANLSLYCDVSAFVTNRFRQQFSSWSAISDALQTVVQVSSSAYHSVNASGLYLKSVAQWDPALPSTDMSEILAQFTEFINAQNESTTKCANVLFDNAVYDDNHVGVAWLNGACNSHNTAVVSHLGLADTSLILAHEAGHLMTALHTEQYTQCSGGTIMDADVSFSAFEFCDHVGSLLSAWGDNNAACLAVLPHTDPEYPHYHDDNDLVYGLVALILFLVVFFAVVWCIVGPLDSRHIHF